MVNNSELGQVFARTFEMMTLLTFFLVFATGKMRPHDRQNIRLPLCFIACS